MLNVFMISGRFERSKIALPFIINVRIADAAHGAMAKLPTN